MPRLPSVEDMGARPTPQSNRQVAVVRNAGAVGEAVAGVGQGLFRAGAELDELKQRQEAARAAVEYARMTEEVQREVDARRENAEPGGAGHTQTVEPIVDQRTGAFLAGIRDPRVRATFEGNVAQLRARVVSGENAWEIGQRRELAVSNYQEAGRILENSLRSNPQAAALREYVDAARSSVQAMGVTGNAGETLVRERLGRLSRAYLEGLTEQNPTAARDILRAGTLNQYLSSEDQNRLIDAADSEIRVREADQRRELSAARATAQSEINLFQRRLTDEDPTITEADIDRIGQLAQQAQLPTEVYDIAKARIEWQVNREFRTATALEIQQAITTLDARIAQGGENASPDDVVRRNRLQAILGRRQQQNQNDPLANYAAAGGNVPALDFADPNAIRGRIQAARAAERQTGYFVPLRPAEVPLLQAQLATPQGRGQVIEQLAAVRAVDPQAALAMARQIAPNDGALRHAMRMGPEARGLVARGAEARGLLPPSMEAPDGQMRSFNQITQVWFSSHIAPSLARLAPDFSNDTLEAARAIYAERMRQAGRLASPEFDEGAFAAAIDTALGRSNGGRGGMGRWNFGPRAEDNDFPGVLLPGGMNQTEFNRRFANLPAPDAHGNRNWNGAANGTPIWGDGSRVSNDDIRRRFVPVAVGDGIYQFRYGNQVLHRREGGPFQINIRRVPPLANPRPQAQPQRPAPTPNRPAIPVFPGHNYRNTSRPGG